MNTSNIGNYSFSGYLANQLAKQFSDNFSEQASTKRTRVAQITCPKEIVGFVAISALSLIEGLFRTSVLIAKGGVKLFVRGYTGPHLENENLFEPIQQAFIEGIGVSILCLKSCIDVTKDVLRGQTDRSNSTLDNWAD